jgi:hypothetical protein
MSRGCGAGGYEVLKYEAVTSVRMERASAKACAPIARAFWKRKD